jgi:hypothetical protein
MTRKMLSIVSFALAFAVLVPLSVTTSASQVNCRVPFSFIVGGQTLPPGLYSVSTSQGYMVMRGSSHNAIALTLAGRERADGKARLVFLKTGDRYDLSEVWSGDGTGLQISAPKHRIDARVASNAPAERIVVLANVLAESR